MLIRVVPVGSVPQRILEQVCAEVEDTLKTRCRILPQINISREAYNHFRRQYDAEKVLQKLIEIPEVKFINKETPTLLLPEYDLYYGGLNFVFGLEEPSKGTAIVSIARLKPDFYDERPSDEKVVSRTVKEVIHEIGHNIGLEHCTKPRCVMSFSPSINDVDIKQKTFCDECKIKMMTRGIEI